MITTRLMKSGDETAVHAYIESHRLSLIYHTLEWQKILSATYGYASKSLICLEDNQIIGFLPLLKLRDYRGKKKIVGLPFSHLVQPLYESPGAFTGLRTTAEAIAKRSMAGYVEIKSDLGKISNWDSSSAYTISELDLRRSLVEIEKGLKPSIRRNVKKARLYGISIRISDRTCDVDRFYDLMVETRHRQGSIPYARSFFANLFRYLDRSKRKLFLAYYRGQPIAGLIMLSHGRRTIYAYGASVSDRDLLKRRPNDLLFWRSIQDAHHEGKDIYDFGVTPFGYDSLLRFKRQWGAVSRKLYYSYFFCKSKTIPRIDRSGTFAKITSGFIKHIPLPIYKMAGPILIKLLG